MNNKKFEKFSEKMHLPQWGDPDKCWVNYYNTLNKRLGYNINAGSTFSQWVVCLIEIAWAFLMFAISIKNNITTFEELVLVAIDMALGAVAIQLVAVAIHQAMYVVRPYHRFLKMENERERREMEKKHAEIVVTSPIKECYKLSEQLKARLDESGAPKHIAKKVKSLINQILYKVDNESMVSECNRYLRTYVNELISALELNKKNAGSLVYDEACVEIEKRVDGVTKAFEGMFNRQAEMSNIGVESSLQAIDQLLKIDGGSGGLGL